MAEAALFEVKQTSSVCPDYHKCVLFARLPVLQYVPTKWSFMSLLRSCGLVCAVVAQLVCSQGMSASLNAETQDCKVSRHILIESSNGSDIRQACIGTERATRFLLSHGFAIPAINIKIVDAMPDGIPKSALGAYSRSRKEIFILSFSVFLDRSKEYEVFNIPVDEAVYTAVIAHEVAHAIAFHNFRVPPTLLAQEYIAFVTFYSTLEESRRENILRNYHYDEDWMQYPVILYLTDQVAFGAHAFRHFQRTENGARFFNLILDGKALGVDE